MRFSHYDSNQNRDQFINELRRECALHFEPEVTETVVMEVDAHLSESIQARLELGDSPEIAEITAVRSFHQPKRFVQAMGQVHRDEVKHDTPMLAIGLTIVCLLAFALDMASYQVPWFVLPAGLLLLGFAHLVRSAKIGDVRVGTLRSLVAAAVLLIGVLSPLRSVNLWAYGGTGYMPNSMALALVSDPDGFLRSVLRQTDSSVSYVKDIERMTKQNIEPAREALQAPLLDKYVVMSSQTVPLLGFCIGLICFTHLLPVAVARRLRRMRYRKQRAG